MIDKRSSKAYDTSIEAIYQLGMPKNQLSTFDLDELDKIPFRKIRVIGDTSPSCYAKKLNEFYNERPDNKILKRH